MALESSRMQGLVGTGLRLSPHGFVGSPAGASHVREQLLELTPAVRSTPRWQGLSQGK